MKNELAQLHEYCLSISLRVLINALNLWSNELASARFFSSDCRSWQVSLASSFNLCNSKPATKRISDRPCIRVPQFFQTHRKSCARRSFAGLADFFPIGADALDAPVADDAPTPEVNTSWEDALQNLLLTDYLRSTTATMHCQLCQFLRSNSASNSSPTSAWMISIPRWLLPGPIVRQMNGPECPGI